MSAMVSSATADVLAIAHRFIGKKSRRAVAAQIRNDHPVARRGQQRRDIDIAVNVVGPAVQKNDRRTIGGAGFGVSDIQDAGIDLLERGERCVRPPLDRGQLRPTLFPPSTSRSCRAGRRQLSSRLCRRTCGDDDQLPRTTCIVPMANSPYFQSIETRGRRRQAQDARRGFFHVAWRSDRNAARSSSEKNFGCSHAAKCPPFGSRL